MAMIDPPRPLPLGTIAVHRVVSAGSELLARFQRWRSVCRTVRILSSLDDGQLEDIGLSRSNIVAFAYRSHF